MTSETGQGTTCEKCGGPLTPDVCEPCFRTPASGRTATPECCAYRPDPESDDRERMECDRVGQMGHQSCGTWPCGCPRFIACPASAPARSTS